jgi:lysophospholipase L1-like esterase
LGSLALTALLFLGAEVVARVAGIEPKPWPSAEGAADFPGVRVDPLLGPLPRPSWSGEWMGGFAVSTDVHGFRSSGLPPPNDPRARVVFLGDSCTFGWGVSTPETFQSLLDARRAKEAKSIEILNAAYPGQSAVSGEYMLAKRVLPLDPTEVVLGFGANNAFRFSMTSDAERFGSFRLRDTLLRSRLFHIAAAALANRRAAGVHPRAREKVRQIAPQRQKRVAGPDEFAGALRRLVDATRAAGAKPVFLIFPRASAVSEQFPEEDVGRARLDGAMSESERNVEELRLLELSCLDQRMEDSLGELRRGLGEWKAVYPDDPAIREMLRSGARAYRDGDAAAASERFRAAIERQPDSPLAHYDLGVASLALGRPADGLDELVRADSLACSIFLRYQLLTWKVARDFDVPVVDLTLFFQAASGEPLFLDQAHPNEAGQRIIADALWKEIGPLL